MRRAVISRESILKTCCEIVAEQGPEALNMRLAAHHCRVVLGLLYNASRRLS